MAFPTKLLNDDEEIVLDLKPHWWFVTPATSGLVGSVVLGIVVATSTGDGGVGDALGILAGLLILAALGYAGIRYAQWNTTQFVITTDRVIYRHGVVAKKGIEIPLERVNTVFFNQSVFERMLGAGDLAIESGSETGRQTFSDVRKPSLVQNEIYRQMEANENRKFDRIAGAGHAAPAAPAAPAGMSIPEQIEKLSELKARGAITDAEYDAKKAELLDRM